PTLSVVVLLSTVTSSGARALPTRRSSDLRAHARPAQCHVLADDLIDTGSFSYCCDVVTSNEPGHEESLRRVPRPFGIACGPAERSEEHTSELQSRFDLGSRLRLDKTKATS